MQNPIDLRGETPWAVQWACPSCRTLLDASGTDELCCPAGGHTYRRVDGIWRFLSAERQAYYARFLHEYQAVRKAEGRGAPDPAYYRALPYRDLSGTRPDDWRIRAASLRSLLQRVVLPCEREQKASLHCLDLGAGNGWLSYRLAQRGHRVGAVDLLTNDWDGLGTFIQYDAPFVPLQAEFDGLPFTDGQFDLAVFNASLHYSVDYSRTLREARRVLKPEGRLVILDSPIYSQADSGAQMVRERQAQFQQKYGFPSDALPSENYLTYRRLEELAEELGIEWQFIQPFYGLRWHLRPWLARLRGSRQPARFAIVVGKAPSGIME